MVGFSFNKLVISYQRASLGLLCLHCNTGSAPQPLSLYSAANATQNQQGKISLQLAGKKRSPIFLKKQSQDGVLPSMKQAEVRNRNNTIPTPKFHFSPGLLIPRSHHQGSDMLRAVPHSSD